MLRHIRYALAVSVILSFALPVSAADSVSSYPSRPVRYVIAQTTGTSVDTLARILGVKMGELLGQQFVADNRGGAGGTIGGEIASQAAPDGYTLLVSSTGMQVISPQIYKKLNYHPVEDFQAISLYAVTQNLFVLNPGFPAKSVKDLIALAKASPGKYNMANAGSGFQSHLAGVLFAHMAGIDVVHVPYKGGASLVAVMGNEAQFTIAPAPAVMGHVRAGRLRAIASGGEKRSPLTPDIPTVIESGVPGYVSTGWAGLMAPRRTPKPIVDKLHATMLKALSDPQTREQMERAGGEPVSSTPQEMLRVIREDYARMGQAIKLAKLKVE
ncbi:MAG TPA: tripartite tricarboxylate transporter substrate binding protein [Burkholderiales bacterium]|nr:tripartite tricarboxylate transporter substrate binding protein [Burkholderiales bacterium]